MLKMYLWHSYCKSSKIKWHSKVVDNLNHIHFIAVDDLKINPCYDKNLMCPHFRKREQLRDNGGVRDQLRRARWPPPPRPPQLQAPGPPRPAGLGPNHHAPPYHHRLPPHKQAEQPPREDQHHQEECRHQDTRYFMWVYILHSLVSKETRKFNYSVSNLLGTIATYLQKKAVRPVFLLLPEFLEWNDTVCTTFVYKSNKKLLQIGACQFSVKAWRFRLKTQLVDKGCLSTVCEWNSKLDSRLFGLLFLLFTKASQTWQCSDRVFYCDFSSLKLGSRYSLQTF